MTSLNCSFSVVGMGGVRNHVPSPKKHVVLHRLATVRRQMGISRRSMARRLGISVAEVKSQEETGGDLPLAALYQWSEALDVPVSELLNEPDASLSPPQSSEAAWQPLPVIPLETPPSLPAEEV